jgi:4-hydroxy-tetrahydrodipicolinate synthase
MFAESNPGPVKAALAAQGRIETELRAPMRRASDALQSPMAATRGVTTRLHHAAHADAGAA